MKSSKEFLHLHAGVHFLKMKSIWGNWKVSRAGSIYDRVGHNTPAIGFRYLWPFAPSYIKIRKLRESVHKSSVCHAAVAARRGNGGEETNGPRMAASASLLSRDDDDADDDDGDGDESTSFCRTNGPKDARRRLPGRIFLPSPFGVPPLISSFFAPKNSPALATTTGAARGFDARDPAASLDYYYYYRWSGGEQKSRVNRDGDGSTSWVRTIWNSETFLRDSLQSVIDWTGI